MSQEYKETYIGDGVYASFDGFAVTLWTERSENGRNWLVLEPAEFNALTNFWTKVHSHCPRCGELEDSCGCDPVDAHTGKAW